MYTESGTGERRARGACEDPRFRFFSSFRLIYEEKKKREKLGELKIKTVLQYNYEYIAKFGLTLGVPAKHPISPKNLN